MKKVKLAVMGILVGMVILPLMKIVNMNMMRNSRAVITKMGMMYIGYMRSLRESDAIAALIDMSTPTMSTSILLVRGID